MGAAAQNIDNKVLRGLVPLDGLSPHNFNEVVSRLQIRQVEKGNYIFKEGDHDANTLYLIEGKIEFQQGGKKVSILRAGSHDAAHPLSPQQPRQNAALAKTRVTIAFIDKTLLDVYSGGTHQENAYEVRDINASADDDDWMTRLLQSDAFLRLPPMNIQRLLMRMQSVPLKALDIVMNEGDDGDAYYTIKHGRCRISRHADDGTEITLAEISDGACFGEDALLSESKRSATITMMTDGELMRLSKKDFLELLNDPLVDHISYSEASELIEQGAKWLDTRNAAEHSAQCIANSINIPMPELRDKLSFLDKNITYIAYCNDGRTSSAATFVLGQNGINSRALNNGISSVDTALIASTGQAQTEYLNLSTNDNSENESATANDAKPESAEIIGFEEPLGAKHIAQIKQLRSELDNLRKLSETRLKHTKLQAHEQVEKLKSELKETKGLQTQSRSHNQDEIKRLKAALYEEQENAATISTSKLETENALIKLLEQINTLKQQDDERQTELNAVQEKVSQLEQAESAANETIAELESKLTLTEQGKSELEGSVKNQIDELKNQLSSAIDIRGNIENELKISQEKIESLTQSEESSIQQAKSHQEEISRLTEELNTSHENHKKVEDELRATKESVNALTQDEKQAASRVKDHLQEIDHLKAKLDKAITAQHQADQEVSVLRGKLEGSKEAQQEVVSKLKQSLEEAKNKQEETLHKQEELRTQLTVAEQELSEKQNTVNDFAKEIENKQSSIESLNKEIDTISSEKNHLNDELESIKSQFNDTTSKNESRIKELTTSVEDGHRENQALQQNNHELKLKLEDAARETERLQVSISGEIDAEIERLLAEVKAKSSELTTLQGALDNTKQNKEELEGKLSDLEQQLQESQSGSKQRIDELENTLQESQQAHKTAEQSAQDHLTTLSQLDQQLKTKESELEENRDKLTSLESEISDSQKARDDLKDKINTLENTQQSLQEKVEVYESKISLLQDAESNSEALAQRVESIDAENEKLRGELENTENELKSVNEQLSNATEESMAAEESLSKIKASAYDIETKITEVNADNETLRKTLAETENQLSKVNSALENVLSNADGSNEEVNALRQTIIDLEAVKIKLESDLKEQQSLIQHNSTLELRIDELDKEKNALLDSIKNNESGHADTAQKVKGFEQEKSILIEKITNSEELISSLRQSLESANDSAEKLADNLEEKESAYELKIAELTSQLNTQINDHQKTNSTLEDLHTNLRTERLDLETQLHEQRLLREQAEAVANSTKLDIEGLRAELELANQQLSVADNNTSSGANSEQLQRLSSDLAKAVEYRKQSEIAKQALQDETNETRKEVARLKGENDGHLELRIQLEGQLAVLRQQISTNPAANEIIDNIKNLTNGNSLGSIPAITDIGQTSWESKPDGNRNYIMIIAIVLALLLIGAGSWLFKSELGLEDEWQKIIGSEELKTEQKVSGVSTQKTPQPLETLTNKNKTVATTSTKPAATVAKPVANKSPATPSLAVTPTSRDVTPVPFRVYRNALKDGGASPIMIEMPAGNFTMGSSVTSDYFEERPHRDVKVKRFAISKHEVNFTEYRKFAKATNRPIPEDEGWGRDNQPVINVSWQDAINYTTWLSEQTGHSFRLPSESEWEYMARAGSQATYWWGNEPRGENANCAGCAGKLAGKQTLAVESYEANPFGIKNVAGNVAEWVQDCYHSSYENAPLDSKAWVINGSCDKRMVRGGSYRSPLNQLRASARDSRDYKTRSDAIGFRVVREY